MNFKAKNLDEAYKQILSISDLVTKTYGLTLTDGLSNNIISLKTHWIGADASKHINNLISLYNSLCKLFSELSGLSHDVSKPIVEAQTIRNSNGGGRQAEEVIPKKEVLATKTELLSDTEEYFVDPKALDDKKALENLSSDFERFKDNLVNIRRELMENWIEGTERPRALKIFDDFEANAASYNKILTEAKDYLATATSNMSSL